MARLQWDVPTTRTAELGVDRGVVFVEGASSGVAWSGLTRVSRSQPDANMEPVYFDGSIANYFVSRSVTAFSIEALSVPPEFAPCLGRVALKPGFYAANQPIASFGFSYRTLIANDTKGTSYGYKIHIVFQAYAVERTLVRQTVGSTVQLSQRGFDVQTVPVQVDGYNPVSFLTVSSETMSPSSLQELEDVLYGTAGTDPTLPTVSEVVSIIS